MGRAVPFHIIFIKYPRGSRSRTRPRRFGGITPIPRTGGASAIHRALMRGEDGEGGRGREKTSGINGINKLHKKQ